MYIINKNENKNLYFNFTKNCVIEFVKCIPYVLIRKEFDKNK